MLFKLKEKEKKYINPRFRAYGKARLDIARRAKSRQDWDELWKGSTNPYPFKLGESWKHCVEYKVDDFAAEVGFYVDILGLPVNAFDPSYAMFTSPGGDFFIGVVPTPDKGTSTPKDAIRLQFMVKNIMETTKELERRGVRFEQQPEPCQPDSTLHIGYFCTPHGIPVDLWGYVGEGKDHSDTGFDDAEDLAEGENGFDDLEDQDKGDIVFKNIDDQSQDETALDDVAEKVQVDLGLEEEQDEDLQLEIPLAVESQDGFGEPQKEERDMIEDNVSREQGEEIVKESLEEKEETEDNSLEVEESSSEYIYEEVPLQDWQIN
jgi:catechol 2,3-dioxygenase-like lactoylglutathione lyase family enzyme